MPKDDALPEPYASLVQTIGAVAPDMGGENRRAVAELQARLTLAQVKVAKALNMATWVLVLATLALVVVTVIQAS